MPMEKGELKSYEEDSRGWIWKVADDLRVKFITSFDKIIFDGCYKDQKFKNPKHITPRLVILSASTPPRHWYHCPKRFDY